MISQESCLLSVRTLSWSTERDILVRPFPRKQRTLTLSGFVVLTCHGLLKNCDKNVRMCCWLDFLIETIAYFGLYIFVSISARLRRCRWRRRPRQFLPENHFVLNFRSETEMTNMKKTKSRFAALREYAKRKRRRRRKPQNRRDLGGGGGVTGIFAQNPNPRRRLERESPIASLKLLQAQQRQLTVDTVLLSDDESGVQGGVSDNDEDLSDSSNEMSPMKNCDASGRKPNMAHKQHGKLEEIDERTGLMPLHSGKTLVPPKGSSRWGLKGPKPNGKASSLKKFIVPDIVIDDTSVTVANRGGEKRARPTRLDNSEQSTSCINSHTGTAKQDNIMWL